MIHREGKEEFQLDSISEAQQAKRLHVCVATIVLSERGTVPSGTSLASETDVPWLLSEWKWIRQAKAVESMVFSTRI